LVRKPTFSSPFRYPGGKGRLARYFSQVIEQNDLHDGVYAEPYAGGGAAALSLLYSEFVKTIHLNDVDLRIVSVWRAMLECTEEFCRLLYDTPVSIDEWHFHRRRLQSTQELGVVETGFSTFYLNRTNHSGIIDGGVIGGQRQRGKWKLDARLNKPDLIARIEKMARFRTRIRVTNLDAARFISEELRRISSRALVYFDPPYFVKGKDLYTHNYSEADHKMLSGLIQSRVSQHWILSYDNHPKIREFYSERRQEEFDLHYSANRRFAGREVMIFDDRLQLPSRIFTSRSSLF
jgi:DNA adenine methylase